MESIAQPTAERDFGRLEAYLQKAQRNQATVAPERREQLDALAGHMAELYARHGKLAVIYICTHNSRRSHLSQVWSQVAAARLGVPGVACYSGGTEATALNARAAAALVRAGLDVRALAGGTNPTYAIRYSQTAPPITGFSKKFNDPANPSEKFLAVMTCTQADEACPVVPGAEARFGLPYDDPKQADGTPEETTRYDERCLQIATEQLYLMHQLSRLLRLTPRS
jgi:hypothetical protein